MILPAPHIVRTAVSFRKRTARCRLSLNSLASDGAAEMVVVSFSWYFRPSLDNSAVFIAVLRLPLYLNKQLYKDIIRSCRLFPCSHNKYLIWWRGLHCDILSIKVIGDYSFSWDFSERGWATEILARPFCSCVWKVWGVFNLRAADSTNMYCSNKKTVCIVLDCAEREFPGSVAAPPLNLSPRPQC